MTRSVWEVAAIAYRYLRYFITKDSIPDKTSRQQSFRNCNAAAKRLRKPGKGRIDITGYRVAVAELNFLRRSWGLSHVPLRSRSLRNITVSVE